jgi:hypothetical protein
MIKPPGSAAEEGPVSEATLMRFTDGDLPPREHAFVAELIAAHPQETNSVRAYRFTRDELPAAFEAALRVPPELIGRCLAGGAADARRAPRPQRRSIRSRWHAAALPLAASIALLFAGAAGWLLRDAKRFEVAGLLGVAPASLQYALDATLTGEVAPLGRGVMLKPMSTFPSIDGRWCRHYVLLTDGEQKRGSGLACRAADGNWRIDVQSASRSVQHQDRGMTAPAGSVDDPVTSYRDQIIGGNVLTKDNEERLIRLEGWRREP